MKGSEAMLRCMAAEGGTISAVQFDLWLGQLIDAALVEKGEKPFTYVLTDKAKVFLQKKGVT